MSSSPIRAAIMLATATCLHAHGQDSAPREGGMFGSDPTLVDDWDDDGVQDYAVGAPFAYVRRGSARGAVVLVSGTSFEPILVLQGREQIDGIGRNIVALPDIDGDGHEEIGVEGNELFVVYGRGGEVRWAVEAELTCLGTSWDVDEDSRPDVVVQRGTEIGFLSSKDGRWLGTLGEATGQPVALAAPQDQVCPVGDLDADGFVDLMVMKYRARDLAVFSGRSGKPLVQLTMDAAMAKEVFADVHPASHDLDGDGERELVLGVPEWTQAGGLLVLGRGTDRIVSKHAFPKLQDMKTHHGYGVRVLDLPDVGPVILAGAHAYFDRSIYAFTDARGTVLWQTTLEDVLRAMDVAFSVYDFGTEIELVPDQDGDGAMDILTGTSQWRMGGNMQPGRLCLLSSRTGRVLRGLKEEDCLR